MSSQLGIVNMAISHLGSAKEVAILEVEKSQEASAARRFYDESLEATLSDFPWPFATRFAALALVEESPTTEWAYSYRYPTDCYYLRKIHSGIRNDSRRLRICSSGSW